MSMLLIKRILNCILFRAKTKQLTAFEKLEEKIKANGLILPFAKANNSLKYIVHIETKKIIWVNEGLADKVGGDVVGKLCHEVLQDLAHPCNFCTNHELKKEWEVYQWEFYNAKLKQWFLIRDFMVIQDGEKLRYESAYPIERKNHVIK